jgi:signal transduction histidine kinase
VLSPRRRHLAIAIGLLSAIALEIVVGFLRFEELPGDRGRAWVVLATTLAILATAGAGLLLFRMSVRQGRVAAEQLAALARERSARLAEIGQLVAGFAHEIHNPLQGVNGYLALLEREGVDLEKRRAHVTAIRGALVKIERLSKDLLDHANPSPPHRVDVAPYDLFRTFDRALAADPRFAAIERRIEVETGVPSALVDPAALERVLLNLSLNARDAMDGRGTLTLRARRGDGAVELEVADEGRGLSPEVMAHLFEPFRSGRGSTGLGLWICRSLVQANGGAIRAERATPSGARFVISLPAGSASLPAGSGSLPARSA